MEVFETPLIWFLQLRQRHFLIQLPLSPPADPNVDIGNLGQPQGMEGAWLICNGQIRYQYIDGSYLFNTWAAIDNQRYRFDENGYRLMGWINLDGLWYYLNDQGVLQTGWINLNNNWYYLDGNGVQVTRMV